VGAVTPISLPAQYIPFLNPEPVRAPEAVVSQPADRLATVLSPSQVRTLMDCGAKWMYKYSLGIPEPKNSHLALGNAVHAAITDHMREKIEIGRDRPVEPSLEAFELAWSAEAAETEFRDDEDPAAIAGVGRGLVAKYIAEAAPRVNPAAVELSVEGEIAGVKVQGRLDIVERNGRIRDIKTASRRSDSISNEQIFQLATYAPFAEGATGEVVVDVLVKTKTPQLIQLDYRLTRADIEATERLYPHAQAVARGELYMPNRTSNLCSRRNCPYWSRCERDFGGRVSQS
jgi:putative RecB family exonuclease